MTLHGYIFILINCLIALTPEKDKTILTIKELKHYEDKGRILRFDQLRENPSLYLSYNTEYVPADYNPEAAYWVELDFCIKDLNEEFVLEFYDQTIDTIDVYLKHESESDYEFIEFGDQFNFDNRRLSHKNFQIILNKAGSYHAYIRVVNREYADIRVSIRSLGKFINYALHEYYIYGLFYGMILIIILYNLLIFLAIRESKYLYYTFYLLSVGLFAMSVDGIGYQMLWPKAPGWNTIAHGVFLYSIIIWSIIFSKKFLKLKSRAPKINYSLNIILAVRSIIFLYALVIDINVFSYRNIEIIPFLLIFIASIHVYKGGYKPARFFIVAYGFLFMGFIIKAMLMYSILPFRMTNYSQFTQIISYYSLHICFLLEMLFLTIALSDRVRILKKNRDLAMKRIVAQQMENLKAVDRINAQLEQKISERTWELKEKNHQLRDANDLLSVQKREISEINTLLDLDNWKLRNNLKSAQTSRILNKVIGFHEFEQIFPDVESAQRFLANHKWMNGYQCKRCENQKYMENLENFSRRCTKCGYYETPTTDTVFHAIKFPVVKAMYILYLTLIGDERSLSILSKKMNLRKNTIWSMKKKIKEHKETYPYENLNIFEDLEERVKNYII